MKSVLRPLPDDYVGTPAITVCVNRRPAEGLALPSCGARGSEDIAKALERGIKARGFEVRFATIRCLGLCDKGPNLRVAPSNSWFHEITIEDVPVILDWLDEHLSTRSAA